MPKKWLPGLRLCQAQIAWLPFSVVEQQVFLQVDILGTKGGWGFGWQPQPASSTSNVNISSFSLSGAGGTHAQGKILGKGVKHGRPSLRQIWFIL